MSPSFSILYSLIAVVILFAIIIIILTVFTIILWPSRTSVKEASVLNVESVPQNEIENVSDVTPVSSHVPIINDHTYNVTIHNDRMARITEAPIALVAQNISIHEVQGHATDVSQTYQNITCTADALEISVAPEISVVSNLSYGKLTQDTHTTVTADSDDYYVVEDLPPRSALRPINEGVRARSTIEANTHTDSEITPPCEKVKISAHSTTEANTHTDSDDYYVVEDLPPRSALRPVNEGVRARSTTEAGTHTDSDDYYVVEDLPPRSALRPVNEGVSARSTTEVNTHTDSDDYYVVEDLPPRSALRPVNEGVSARSTTKAVSQC